MITVFPDYSDVKVLEDKLVARFVVEILIIQMEEKLMNKRMILEMMITWILMKFLCIHTIHQRMKGKSWVIFKNLEKYGFQTLL